MTSTNQVYQQRINAVIDYIDANLDKTFSLEELADVAHFSSFHFHRIFVALMGESINFYTNRARLEKAARLLKFSSNALSSIAFDCGFSSPSTFSRSFKQYFGKSPSIFRKNGAAKNRKNCKELFPMEQYLVPMTLEEKQKCFPVTIKELPKRKVAYIRVIDSYREGVVLEAFEKLISWAKANNLYSNGQFFGMSLDDPMVTPKSKYRYEACLLVPNDIEPKKEAAIEYMYLPKCKYASTMVHGDIKQVATATSYLFNEWLISSVYEPEHLHGLEYFLDQNNICNWEYFNLELFIPIKSLKNY